MKTLLTFAIVALILSGCVHLQQSRSLIISPEKTDTRVAATATATVHCQDFLFIYTCKMTTDLKESK